MEIDDVVFPELLIACVQRKNHHRYKIAKH
jgi:hypothetical protein